jgi:uncharacterized protein (TIGR00251 family)
MISIRDTPGGAVLAIKLHPRAKQNAITGVVGGALKLAVTAPPVDGRANEACIEFLASLFAVPRSSITIASGETSRRKAVRIAGMSADELRRKLET